MNDEDLIKVYLDLLRDRIVDIEHMIVKINNKIYFLENKINELLKC